MNNLLMRRYSALPGRPSFGLLETLPSSPHCSARPTVPRDERDDEMEQNQPALTANLPARSAVEIPAAPAPALRRRTGSGLPITPKRVVRAYNKEVVMGT